MDEAGNASGLASIQPRGGHRNPRQSAGLISEGKTMRKGHSDPRFRTLVSVH